MFILFFRWLVLCQDGLELLILLPAPLQCWDDSWDGNQGFCVLSDCPDPCAPAPVMWSMAEEQALWPQVAVHSQDPAGVIRTEGGCPSAGDRGLLHFRSFLCVSQALLLGLEYGAFSKPGQPCAAEQYNQLSDG